MEIKTETKPIYRLSGNIQRLNICLILFEHLESKNVQRKIKRGTHGTFEGYCLDRWGMTNRYANNLIAHKAKIRAIQQTRMAIAAQEAALADTQYMAEILLDAEVRLGEILEAIPPAGNTLTSVGGRKGTLPPDITHKQSHQAQTLSKRSSAIGTSLESIHPRARKEGSPLVSDTPEGDGNRGKVRRSGLKTIEDPFNRTFVQCRANMRGMKIYNDFIICQMREAKAMTSAIQETMPFVQKSRQNCLRLSSISHDTRKPEDK